MKFPFLRGVASFVLALAGGALFLLSVAVAFGWDRGPLSVGGTIIAISGLGLMLGAYWLVRSLDGAPLTSPSFCTTASERVYITTSSGNANGGSQGAVGDRRAAICGANAAGAGGL